MITKKQKWRLFINSLGIFLISFLCVKIIIILVKYIVARSFGIETILVNFRLIGISQANSGVWTQSSVRTFYSIDLLVPLIIFIRAFLLFRYSIKKPTIYKVYYLWFGFSAVHSFCAAIVAGLVTNTNVFHFFQWLFIPNYLMMLIVFCLLPLILVFGWFYNKQYIITSPIKEEDYQLYNQRRVLFYSMFLPVVAGSFFLILSVSIFFHKYDFYEFFILFVMTVPVLLYFYPYKYSRPSPNFSAIIKYKTLYMGLIGCTIFLIINIITHI
jgi:hypothetical protein